MAGSIEILDIDRYSAVYRCGRVVANGLAQMALPLCKPLGELHFKWAVRQARCGSAPVSVRPKWE
jgi:hypothetical protein